jgi:hypothetical protein
VKGEEEMLFKINLSKPLMISCMHGDSRDFKIKNIEAITTIIETCPKVLANK